MLYPHSAVPNQTPNGMLAGLVTDDSGPPPGLRSSTFTMSYRDTSEEQAKTELILDNLLYGGEKEAEDTLLVAASPILQWLVDQARQEPFSSDWERELYEL